MIDREYPNILDYEILLDEFEKPWYIPLTKRGTEAK